MKVHDTPILVARAHAHHAFEDRITRGHYGVFLEPNAAKIKAGGMQGCQIACLATDPTAIHASPLGNETALVERIQAEFGIHRSVVRLGEIAFENCLPSAKDARDFVVLYAEAFHEAAYITPEMAFAFSVEAEEDAGTVVYAERLLGWIDGVKPTMRDRLDACRSVAGPLL